MLSNDGVYAMEYPENMYTVVLTLAHLALTL